jgi:hypothetical protein
MQTSPALRARRAAHAILLMLLSCLLAGCGKSAGVGEGGREATPGTHGGSATTTLLGSAGAGGLATANTTRLGGSSPVADAAAVARAVYPGLTPASRPQAVVIVDAGDWPAALAASSLAGAPLQAPILYAQGGALPAESAAALAAMQPSGSPALRGAQVIAVGVPPPAGYRTLSLTGADPYTLAGRIVDLVDRLHGGRLQAVVLASATAPPALSMPAASLSAQSGAPILLLGGRGVPPSTSAALRRLHDPPAYVIGPEEAVDAATMSELQRAGEATRIGAPGDVANAIKVAAFGNGRFGWGVDEPGHGLAFARLSRPLDAPAAAPLAANGDYAPLLLLSAAEGVPPELQSYLKDIQPGYGSTPESLPVRGVYNRGWLIGDERAISAVTQSQLDALLRTEPRSTPPPQPSVVP